MWVQFQVKPKPQRRLWLSQVLPWQQQSLLHNCLDLQLLGITISNLFLGIWHWKSKVKSLFFQTPCSDSVTSQEKRFERAEAPAPKVTPRTPVQSTANPPSSTQPVSSPRPQPSAASTPATPSKPVPAAATLPTPTQVTVFYNARDFSCPPRWWDLLRIEGNAVVGWLALVLSLSFSTFSACKYSTLFICLHFLTKSQKRSLLPQWALRLWDLRVWQVK